MPSQSITPRKLKRRASKPAPITIFESPCILGCCLKSPEIIPVQVGKNGEQFVQIKTNAKWIHAVLTGYQSSTVARAILSKAIEDIRACLRVAAESLSSAGGDGGIHAEAMNAMRAKMLEAGLDSDSDQSGEDDGGSISEIEEKKAPKNKGKKGTTLDMLLVRVHEIDLEVAMVRKKLVLMYTKKNVEDFLRLCLHYDQKGALEHQEEKKRKRDQRSQEL